MIRLFGDDARTFIDAIYTPNKERKEHQKELDNIEIIENTNGFTAIISDFDLSFLNALK